LILPIDLGILESLLPAVDKCYEVMILCFCKFFPAAPLFSETALCPRPPPPVVLGAVLLQFSLEAHQLARHSRVSFCSC